MHEPLPATHPAKAQAAARFNHALILGCVLLAALTVGTAALRYDHGEALAIAGWTVALLLACILAIREIRVHAPAIRRSAQTRSQLAHENELHRRIFETSLDLILVTDRPGCSSEVSPSCEGDPRLPPGGDDRPRRHRLHPSRRSRSDPQRDAAGAARARDPQFRKPLCAQGRPSGDADLDRRLVGARAAPFLHRPRHDGAKAARERRARRQGNARRR